MAAQTLVRQSIEEMGYLVRTRQKNMERGLEDALVPFKELIKGKDVRFAIL